MPEISKDRAVELIRHQLDEIPEVKAIALTREALPPPLGMVTAIFGIGSKFYKWHRSTLVCISKIFGERSEHYKELLSIKFLPESSSSSQEQKREALDVGLNQTAGILESMIEEIQNYWDKEQPSVVRIKNSSQSKQIFVVHGRDEGIKETASRFLRQLNLEPIILDEQASRGATIIEKFERHTNVGFALVLLTPDDEGSLRGEDINPRARQNVIFELGFFLGCLGRGRVIVLKRGEIEIPSDYTGVLYIELDDNNEWKMALIRELKSAGCEVEESG